jgi:Flp pilus assembly protein TadG
LIAQQLPQTLSRRRNGHFDRGAAAVEMALVLPVLLFILMGLIDFGRAYNAQIQLSAAAREGVRLASLNTTANTADANYGNTAIENRVHSAAGGVPNFTVVNTAANAASCPVTSNSVCIVYCPASALASDNATVVVISQFTWITGISAMSKFFGSGAFPTPTTLQVTGVMQCTGAPT